MYTAHANDRNSRGSIDQNHFVAFVEIRQKDTFLEAEKVSAIYAT